MSGKTRVVNFRDVRDQWNRETKTWADPNFVYVGRAVTRAGVPASKWGNPYKLGKDGDRETMIARYRAYIAEQPELLASLNELRGKTLVCWCKPLACHGDVLAELADALPDDD